MRPTVAPRVLRSRIDRRTAPPCRNGRPLGLRPTRLTHKPCTAALPPSPQNVRPHITCPIRHVPPPAPICFGQSFPQTLQPPRLFCPAISKPSAAVTPLMRIAQPSPNRPPDPIPMRRPCIGNAPANTANGWWSLKARSTGESTVFTVQHQQPSFTA